jgi:hypothetical protein
MGMSGQRHAPTAPRSWGRDSPGTHCTGGWLDLRAGLDTEARGKTLSPLSGIEHRSVDKHPVICTNIKIRLIKAIKHAYSQSSSLYRFLILRTFIPVSCLY